MRKIGYYLDKFVANLGYLGVAIGVVCLTWMMLMVSGNVLLRYFFNRPQLFVDEIARYCLVAIVFMGYAYTARTGAHVTVDLVTRNLRERVRDVLDVVTSVVVLVLMGIYLWYGWHLFVDYLQSDMRSRTSLQAPLWIPVSFIWLGVLFVCLELVAHIVKKCRSFQKWSRKEEGEDMLETLGVERANRG